MTKSRGIRVRTGTRPLWVAENQGKHFCQCGCGAEIPLAPAHFNLGVPRFLLGHNSRVANPRKGPVVPATPCECGCKRLATPGRRFISGHNGVGQKRSPETRAKISAGKMGEKNPHYGKRPHNYKGWQRTGSGYIYIPVTGHPFRGKRGAVMEHRLFVEAHLREADPTNEFLVEVDGALYISPDVDVHHLNGIKDDNRLENLKPMWAKDHRALHHEELIEASRRAKAAKTHCPHGHPLSGTNLYVTPVGARQCRACKAGRTATS